MDKIIEDLQRSMAQRYDKEFNDMKYFIDIAYAKGIADGVTQAKSDIINMIQGEQGGTEHQDKR